MISQLDLKNKIEVDVSKVVLCGYIWLLLITANSGFLLFWNQRTRDSRFLKEIKIKDSSLNPAISKPQRTTGFQKRTSKEPTIFWAVRVILWTSWDQWIWFILGRNFASWQQEGKRVWKCYQGFSLGKKMGPCRHI